MINYKIPVLSLIIVAQTSLFCATIVQGDSIEVPYGFSARVGSAALDPLTGYFFVALNTPTNLNYSISRASRPTFTAVPKFTPIATSTALQGNIEFMTLASQPSGAPFVVAVQQGSTDISVATADGVTVQTSIALNDATGAAETAAIDGITAGAHTVFAAVAPNGGTFMQSNGGIAVLDIETLNNTLSAVQVKDATTGVEGNKAAPFSISSAAINDGTATGSAQDSNVSMFYDSVLGRLYLGVQVATAAVPGAIANSVAIGYLDSTKALMIQAPVASSALSSANNTIVSVQSSGSAASVTTFQLNVMHVSTGPDYLIVNGGQGVAATVGNTIYALPLVNNPNSPTTHGTLAAKGSALSNGVFTVPATTTSDLPLATDTAAMVGAGPLPILAADEVNDMQVVGDAVYVSLSTVASSLQDTGIFSSQAQFDSSGKIVRWTPWTFHLVPHNLFPGVTLPGGATSDGRVTNFAVDQQTGALWFVEGTTDQVVGVTFWNRGLGTGDLVSTLNQSLATGSYVALDLNRDTRGFDGATNYRYALFGTNGAVIFANTSVANGAQEVVPTTFSAGAGTLLSTPILGTPRTLEYTRGLTGEADNFFFAGTENGLFAFANSSGGGFDVNTLGLLNGVPFTGGSWQQILALPGEPLAIKTLGTRNLYVLMRQLSSNSQMPFVTTLYSIPIQPTLAAMFAPGNISIIAQSGVGTFANVSYLSDIALVATGPIGAVADEEQLVLATNKGLYYSTAAQNGSDTGVAFATTSAAAGWTLLDGTADITFNGISTMDTPEPSTLWPLAIVDPSGEGVFDRGAINQLSGYSPDGTTVSFNNRFIPANFNSNENQPGFATFDLVNSFYDDGSRRLFIADRAQDPATINVVMASPFNPSAWAMNRPFLIDYPFINQQNRFYWIKQIGATGYLMAGTNQGVIALS